MATKRRPRRPVRHLALLEMGFDVHFAFYIGWCPGRNLCSSGPAPWDDWTEFLSDWQAVRDEVRARPDDFFGGPVEQCFAEFLLQRYGPDGPGPLDELEVSYSPYRAVDKQPKYQVEFREWRAARHETRG